MILVIKSQHTGEIPRIGGSTKGSHRMRSIHLIRRACRQPRQRNGASPLVGRCHSGKSAQSQGKTSEGLSGEAHVGTNAVVVGVPEWESPRHHGVEHHPARPYVGLLPVVCAVLQHLRCHTEQRAHTRVCRRVHATLLGKPKVAQLHLKATGEKGVRELDVPVDDLFLPLNGCMKVFNSTNQLPEDVQGMRFPERDLGHLHELRDCEPINKLHYYGARPVYCSYDLHTRSHTLCSQLCLDGQQQKKKKKKKQPNEIQCPSPLQEFNKRQCCFAKAEYFDKDKWYKPDSATDLVKLNDVGMLEPGVNTDFSFALPYPGAVGGQTIKLRQKFDGDNFICRLVYCLVYVTVRPAANLLL